MKFIKFLIIFFFIVFDTGKLLASNILVNELKLGGKIIFIRHAYAPGNGDPDNFSINDCSTQRNLNNDGIEQSKNIGLFFRKNQIPIDKILSSEWCRCKDTAFYAFKNFQISPFLNSFYDEKFRHNKEKQVREIKVFIKNWESRKNLILVTHYVVISEILSTSAESGEIIISDKNFNLLGRIKK